MSLRTSLQRLAGRDPTAPTLRERAASLRDRLTATSTTNQGRRALVVGSLAAVVPLPAISAPMAAGDADLLALVAPFRGLLADAKCADEAANASLRAYRVMRPDRPVALSPADRADLHLSREPEEDAEGRVRGPDGSFSTCRYVFTAESLRSDLPHLRHRSRMARRVRAKLPIAEAYEAAEAEARERSGVTAALSAHKEARDSLERMAAETVRTKAETLPGLAFKASVFDAVRQPGLDTGTYLFVVHGRDFPANLTAVLGNPLLTA